MIELVDPEPVPGCRECLTLDDDRAMARLEGDLSLAVDCNVLMRRHQRADHRDEVPDPARGTVGE